MTRLINAKLRLQRAREACAHWDFESDDSFEHAPHDCCFELHDARIALERAQQTAAKGER